jgi:hypothetical protein
VFSAAFCCIAGALLAPAFSFGDSSFETVRAKISRAAVTPQVNRDLVKYGEAYCTPVEYFHADARNRAAQCCYMWDADAFYVAIRTLDEQQFSSADLSVTGMSANPLSRLYVG